MTAQTPRTETSEATGSARYLYRLRVSRTAERPGVPPQGRPPAPGGRDRGAAGVVAGASRTALVGACAPGRHRPLMGIVVFLRRPRRDRGPSRHRPKFPAVITMARTAADAAISAPDRALIEWGRRHRHDVGVVPPAHATMDRARCGARAKHALPLSERTYARTACGAVSPRPGAPLPKAARAWNPHAHPKVPRKRRAAMRGRDCVRPNSKGDQTPFDDDGGTEATVTVAGPARPPVRRP